MALFKKNVVLADIKNYYIHIKGEPKIGKTRLVYELFKYKYNNNLDKVAMISVGAENGHLACDGLPAVTVKDWDGLMEAKEKIINSIGTPDEVEMICIDTTDELIRIAEEEIIVRSIAEQQNKKKTLNSAYGGYGEGRKAVLKLVTDELLSELYELFGLITIGHTKMKTISLKNGDEFLELGSKVASDYEYIFSSKAYISAVISQDRTCRVEKETDDKGKVVKKVGYLEDSKREIHFRSDDFTTDCGGRFPDIVSKIDYDPVNFVKSIEEAIEKSKIGGFTKAEIIAQDKEREVERQAILERKTAEAMDEELDNKRTLVAEMVTENPEVLTDGAFAIIETMMSNTEKTELKDIIMAQTDITLVEDLIAEITK